MAEEEVRRAAALRFRYATAALRGPWRASEAEALEDALQAGQAFARRGKVVLFEFARVERALLQAP